MADENRHEVVSEPAKRIVLIIFSAIAWGLFWKEIWHYIGKAANFSLDAILKNFSSTTPEKQIEMFEAIKNNFHYPHLFFGIANIILVPLFVGLYIGRHDGYKKHLDVVITVSIVLIAGPTFDLLFKHHEIIPFIITVLFKSYLLFPLLFCIAALGAWVGGFQSYSGDNALYLRIYRNVREKRKEGFLYSAVALNSMLIGMRRLSKQY